MKTFKNILVIKMKMLGDVLLSTPVLPALKGAWPDARVTFLVARGTEEIIAGHPLLDELLVLDRYRKGRGAWGEALRLVRHLRRRRFDLVLELTGGDRGAIYSLVTGARERISLDYPRRGFWHYGISFTRMVPQPPAGMHMVEQHLEPLKVLGLNPDNPQPQFFWDSLTDRAIKKLMRQKGLEDRGFVVMHPGAASRRKSWTPAGYARAIEVLQGDFKMPVVLTASPVPHEQELVAAILAAGKVSPINLAGRLSLKELGALISRARLFFGVDSCPMHLAAAVNTPVAAIFGHTWDSRWRPWGEGHLVIKKHWECQPCVTACCSEGEISPCLAQLTPAEVISSLVSWINGRRLHHLKGPRLPLPPHAEL